MQPQITTERLIELIREATEDVTRQVEGLRGRTDYLSSLMRQLATRLDREDEKEGTA